MVEGLNSMGRPFLSRKSAGLNTSPVLGSNTVSRPFTKSVYMAHTSLFQGLLGIVAKASSSRSMFTLTLRVFWLQNFPLIREA